MEVAIWLKSTELPDMGEEHSSCSNWPFIDPNCRPTRQLMAAGHQRPANNSKGSELQRSSCSLKQLELIFSSFFRGLGDSSISGRLKFPFDWCSAILNTLLLAPWGCTMWRLFQIGSNSQVGWLWLGWQLTAFHGQPISSIFRIALIPYAFVVDFRIILE